MEKVFVTTEVLCDFLANKKEVVELLEKLEKHALLACSPFVLFELFCLAEASEHVEENTALVLDLAHRLRILEWTPETSALAAKIFTASQKAGKKLDLRDIFIGVLAKQHGYILLTTTPDLYKDIPEIKIYK